MSEIRDTIFAALTPEGPRQTFERRFSLAPWRWPRSGLLPAARQGFAPSEGARMRGHGRLFHCVAVFGRIAQGRDRAGEVDRWGRSMRLGKWAATYQIPSRVECRVDIPSAAFCTQISTRGLRAVSHCIEDCMTTIRHEADFLGTQQIPADAYWGVHTARAVENFPITGQTVSQLPELIRALACPAAGWPCRPSAAHAAHAGAGRPHGGRLA